MPFDIRRVQVTTRLLLITGTMALSTWATTTAAGQTAPASTDPYLWLEDLASPRALTWVKAENAKTLGVLQKDARFAGFYAEALKIGEAKDRIPSPVIIDGRVYNFWQDRDHVRGIWRTTTLTDYGSAEPTWTTVLDLDTLAAGEGKNWIWQGADCDSPSRRRCLLSLSDGGEDAATIREFDLTSRQFVPDGFTLPRGKQIAAWAGEDTLLVAREWAPGDLTTSGYPFIAKWLARGAPLSSATELFRGTPADVWVFPFAFSDGLGHRALGLSRGLSFFESDDRLVTPTGLKQLALPRKVALLGLIQNRLLVRVA
jgi:prolyl oligopeptidase